MSTKDKCRYLLTAAKKLKLDGDISSLQFDILKELILSFDEELYADPSLPTTKHRVSKYTKEIYDALFENLSLEQAHIIATTYADELNQDDRRALVYGEVDFESFAEVLKAAIDGMPRCHKFIDLGHGTGRAILVAALLCNFKEYTGIEILRGLYETSSDILHKFNRSVAPLLCSRDRPKINFIHGSFLSDNEDWSDADLVFANSTCFPDELIVDIEVACRRLKVGARVITFTSSLRSEFFKIIFKKRLFMSWGPATVFIHERMEDTAVVSGVLDRLERRESPPAPPSSAPLPPPPLDTDLNSVGSGSALSTTVLPPVHTDDSSSLGTVDTPGNTIASNFSTSSEWDPDTPTLKAWAKHNLRVNMSEMGEGEEGDEGDNDEYFDQMTGKFNGAVSLSSDEDREGDGGLDDDDADDEGTDGCDDFNAEEDTDFSRLDISRLAFQSDGNGVIFQVDDDNDHDDYYYDDDDCDDEVVDTRVERYFHVADDSEEDAEEEDYLDDVYDDSS